MRLGPGPADDPPSNNLFTFENFRGRHNGGDVTFRGTARPSVRGTLHRPRPDWRAGALDAEMAAAFARMKLHNVWELFGPSGRMNFTASVAHRERPDGPPEYDIRVNPAGATLRPTFFPYTMSGLNGSFRLTRGRVELGEFRRPPRADRVAAGRRRSVTSRRAVTTRKSPDWTCGRYRPTPISCATLPPAIRSACQALQPRGAFARRTRVN